MGVVGFTKFINVRSNIFYESFKLKNCYIVIDGHAIAINLYLDHTKANDCFGGDYDNYANTVHHFFELLKKCGVTPIILFDGGFEKRRFDTLMKRMKDRIKAVERRNRVFPMFVKDLFKDIEMELNITCIRNEFECDSKVAYLARNLNSPLLSNDSDFYFFNTVLIPFTTFKMRVEREVNGGEYYIPCEAYSVEKFLKHFQGLSRGVLPVLPALLGNDYVQKGIFNQFYQYILESEKMNEDGNNGRQILIEAVISWLKHKTLETAVGKILGRFEESKRRQILVILRDAMQGYFEVNSSLTQYLKESEKNSVIMKSDNFIDIMKIEPILEEGFEDFYSLDSENINELQSTEHSDNISNNNLSNSFSENYRKCLLPQGIMDIKMWDTYFCNTQIEDISEPHSHLISENILINIHDILKKLPTKKLTIITRDDNDVVEKELSSNSMSELPKFEDIQTMDREKRETIFCAILKIDNDCLNCVMKFPPDWQIFIIALFYWKINSQKTVGKPFIYPLILCSMFLNVVDSRIGYCRSVNHLLELRNFENREFGRENTKSEISFERIDFRECLRCSKVLLNFFHCKTSHRSFNTRIVGMFSEFQSCLQHVKYLNALFDFPFNDIMISKFFNGTFLYNLAVHFNQVRNPACVQILLNDCRAFYNSFQIIIDCIYNYLGERNFC